MFYFDPTYILVLIGAVISMIASARVNSTYARYSKVRSASGMTGAQAAARIMNQAGLYGIRIEHISGNLTDHYDPRSKVLRLSDSVYQSASIAAIGVAAHECGHAIQDQEEYFPLKFRNTLVPVANIGTKLAIPIILVGVVFSASQTLINIGVVLFSLGVLFQLVTLPVEFNASRRAIGILEGTGMLYGQEVDGAKKVLGAAAMTYVAAAAASILSLLRLMLLFGGRRSDD
ncbi:MAG: zinc metallopeptidase [Lachnospiraceae bacterium]|jgi:Zn-dependent membrane protease YugP|nr:zinc metallopeptidase [Lachnospiraceae bacterium]